MKLLLVLWMLSSPKTVRSGTMNAARTSRKMVR
jgi:hypothetical protein